MIWTFRVICATGLRKRSGSNPQPPSTRSFCPCFMKTMTTRTASREQRLSSVFDYLPQNALFVLNDPLAMNQAAQNAAANIDKLLYKAKASGKFYLESAGVYLDEETLDARLARFRQIRLSGLTLDDAKQQNPIGDARGSPGDRWRPSRWPVK